MRKPLLLGLVPLIIVTASTAGCTSNVRAGTTQPKTVTIGALVPLTGSSASIGAPVNSTIRVAEADVNDYLAATNANTRVHLVVKDAGVTPEEALAAIKVLHADGVVAVVGPYSSSALKAIAPYAARTARCSSVMEAPSLCSALNVQRCFASCPMITTKVQQSPR